MIPGVKHAGEAALERLESLLGDLRALEGEGGLREKKRGVFYRRSRAFLHFHEDPGGLYADVRLGAADFERLRVSTRAEQRALVGRVREFLADA